MYSLRIVFHLFYSYDVLLGAVMETGRSINLVITSRGIHALTSLSEDLAQRVMGITTRVDGRTIHNLDGSTVFQSYGPTSAYCNFSVSRWELNKVLLDAAIEAGCQVFFAHPLAHMDVPSSTLFFYLQDPVSKQFYQKSVAVAHIFGADGGGSRCRLALKGMLKDGATDICQPLHYGYKELRMPAGADGTAQIHDQSLHIWPRGSHFLMGLANRDGSFTMTYYMPDESIRKLTTPEAVEAFFEENYPSALKHMPTYKEDFLRNPAGFLGTVFADPWIYKDKVALIGDAAHAITPFFGQGCNCGFEDVSVLDEVLTRHSAGGREIDMQSVFSEYQTLRKPNTDAIANMALENFTEMMSKTADKRFLLEKDIENALANKFPAVYTSRYALITHSLLPYHLCQEVGKIHQEILSQLSSSIDTAEQVDMELARTLLDTRLVPFLSAQRITPEVCLYNSKYYDK
jgi:kynurenine 3-monooxygenase